jgi:hypothetical protein
MDGATLGKGLYLISHIHGFRGADTIDGFEDDKV